MIVMWAVKDMISGKFVTNNHYWSFALSGDIDKAHLWNKQAHAKGFITSNGNNGRGDKTTDLIPVPVEVSRKAE
jgi:hypothetical protein